MRCRHCGLDVVVILENQIDRSAAAQPQQVGASCRSRRRDGALHVGAGAIDCSAEYFVGRGVDVVELASGLGFDELAVDEHADFVSHWLMSFTTAEVPSPNRRAWGPGSGRG